MNSAYLNDSNVSEKIIKTWKLHRIFGGTEVNYESFELHKTNVMDQTCFSEVHSHL